MDIQMAPWDLTLGDLEMSNQGRRRRLRRRLRRRRRAQYIYHIALQAFPPPRTSLIWFKFEVHNPWGLSFIPP